MTSRYILSARALAAGSRNRLGLALTEPIGDIFRLVREDSLILFLQPAGSDGPDGMFAQYRGLQFGWINSSKPHVRQRFTIAHEYGHSMFKDPGLVIDEDVLDGTSLPEKRANVFAAEFLAPQPAIDLWLARHEIDPGLMSLADVVRLGVYLGVSAEVALYRLRDALLVSEKKMARIREALKAGEHRGLSAYLGYQDWDDTIKCLDPRGPHLPIEMREAAWDLFRNGLIDEERLASLLRRSPQGLAEEVRAFGSIRTPDDDDDIRFELPAGARS